MYNLGQFEQGGETKNLEFKEFRLRLTYDSSINYKDLYENTEKLKYLFDGIMEINMKKYVPKYTCAFFNSRLDGILRFGVSDIGEIIGVPIKKNEIRKYIERIKYYISREITQNVNNNSSINLINHIGVSFIPINTDDHVFDTYPKSEDYINDKTKERQNYITMYNTYRASKILYIKEVEKHRRSINIIINDPEIREDFRNYLKYHGQYHNFESLIGGSDEIILPDSSIKILKHDTKTLTHWITRYRDDKTDHIIKNLRPTWNYSVRPVNPHFSILQEFRPMVSTLTERNFGMYIIDIYFNFSEISSKTNSIYYYVDGEVRSPWRTYSSCGEPCCMIEN